MTDFFFFTPYQGFDPERGSVQREGDVRAGRIGSWGFSFNPVIANISFTWCGPSH
jgi:hypothetical protein